MNAGTCDAIHLIDCWAKTSPETGLPALTVRDHCLIVGAVAEAISKRLPPGAKRLFPVGGETLVAAHDIGKISPGFQQKCPASRIGTLVASRHEGNHAKIGQGWLDTLPEMRDDDGRSLAWTLSVGAHHGSYFNNLVLSRELRAEAQSFPLGGIGGQARSRRFRGTGP